MVQFLLQQAGLPPFHRDSEDIRCIEYEHETGSICLLPQTVVRELLLPENETYLFTFPNGLSFRSDYIKTLQDATIHDFLPCDGLKIEISLPVNGGMDFQNRVGGKTGSGGQMSESQAALERKERLRKLALETIDITKDPYFMRNHLGTFECKLCLTLHPNEGNYLAHTQGKRHQYNLGRRAAMEAKNAAPRTIVIKEAPTKRVIKIGRPGYRVSFYNIFLFEQLF